MNMKSLFYVFSSSQISVREVMHMKRFAYIKKTLFLLFIGMLTVSGCGRNGDFSSGMVAGKEISTEPSETGNKVTTESGTETENNANTESRTETENAAGTEESEAVGSAQGQPMLLEVPVSSEKEDILYHRVDGIDISFSAHRCQSDGENLYLVYGAAGELDLYVMPIGADEHFQANIDNPEGMVICHIAIDIYGKMHLLVGGNNFEEWYIWCLDENKQVEEVINVSDYFDIKQMAHWFLVDKEGNYYLQWVLSRDGVILDSEGTLKHRFTLESLDIGWIYEAAVGKDGLIYVIYRDRGDEKVRIGEFDVESGSIIKEDSPLYFSCDEIFNGMSRGTDTNILLFSRYSGIWAYDQEQGILENRVPLSEMGLARDEESYPLTFLPDGRFVLLQGGKDGIHIKYIPARK